MTVAHHQPVTVLIDLLSMSVDVGAHLGLQRRGQHLPRAVTHNLVEQRFTTGHGGLVVGLIVLLDYLEHGRTFPNQRDNAGP